MKLYRTSTSFWITPDIKEVEVEKYTLSSVWINGRKTARYSNYGNYFGTHEAAKTFLLENATNQLNNAMNTVRQIKKRIEEINALK